MKTVPLSHLPVPLLFPSLICQEGDSSPPPKGPQTWPYSQSPRSPESISPSVSHDMEEMGGWGKQP